MSLGVKYVSLETFKEYNRVERLGSHDFGGTFLRYLTSSYPLDEWMSGKGVMTADKLLSQTDKYMS